MHYLGKLVIFLQALVLVSCKSNLLTAEKEKLDAILSPTTYDPSIRPSGKNDSGPVIVGVNVYIRSITDIDDVKMEYSTQLTFRQEWIDDRLKYDDRRLHYLTLTRPEKIWRPDLFFSNEKTGHFHNIVMPNDLIRIFPDGRVLYSTRISLKLFCPMNLRYYPLDRQTCEIRMASYGYTTEDILFGWKAINEPVQIPPKLNLPKFTLNGFSVDYCTSKTNTGEYSCLKIMLNFSRDVSYHLEQAYLPTIALVFLSWITFWLDQRSMTIRLAIWLGVLLAMVIKASSITASNPAISYTKAIDVWIGTCLLFIISVLVELCLVNNYVTTEDKQRLASQLAMEEAKSDQKHTMCIDDHGKQNHMPNFTITGLRWLNKFPTKAQRIDAISRFLFPAAFAFFNLIYWLSYTSKRLE